MGRILRRAAYNPRSQTREAHTMLAKLEQSAALLSADDLRRVKHALVVLPKTESLAALRGVPGVEALAAALSRRRKKPADLAKSPVATEVAGTLVAWVMLDPARPVFELHTLLRKGLPPLLAEKPGEITIGTFGPAGAPP